MCHRGPFQDSVWVAGCAGGAGVVGSSEDLVEVEVLDAIQGPVSLLCASGQKTSATQLEGPFFSREKRNMLPETASEY